MHKRAGRFFWGEGCIEFARMTRRHRFCDVIVKLYTMRRLKMIGFPLKIDRREIKKKCRPYSHFNFKLNIFITIYNERRS